MIKKIWWLFTRYIVRTRTPKVARCWIALWDDGRVLNDINEVGVWWDRPLQRDNTKYTTGAAKWADVFEDLRTQKPPVETGGFASLAEAREGHDRTS